MKALDAMLPSNAGERRTLADIIFAKLDNLESAQVDTAQHEQGHQGELHTPFLRLIGIALSCCRLRPLPRSRRRTGPQGCRSLHEVSVASRP